MPDPDQGDHWDFLAADLGASPAPEPAASPEDAEPPADELELELSEESSAQESVGTDADVEREGAEDQPEKPKKRSGSKGDRVVSGFGYRRGSVDWVNLARELGVEAMEEVPAPIPASEAAGESVVSPQVEEGLVEVVEVVETHIETTSHSARRDEPVSAAFGAGILENANLESTSSADDLSADQDEDQEERKGRRRRRRRKPKKAEATEGQPAEPAEIEEVAAEDISSGQTDDEETEDRPRRRGRRRGGRRREPREKVAAESKEFGAGLEAEDAIGDQFEDFEVVDTESEDAEPDDSAKSKQHQGDRPKERRPKKITHRGIPCWEEAVGHIIDSNMDSRSKRPEPNGSRQRSGRRRGGDRSGNRGRS